MDTGNHTLAAAPELLQAFLVGPEAFNQAVAKYAVCQPVPSPNDAGEQECLELLHSVLERLQSTGTNQQACLYLLKHLAARSLDALGTGTQCISATVH